MYSSRMLCAIVALSCSLFASASQHAHAQNSDGKRIVFLAGKPSHGYGSHEHLAGCRVLAGSIQQALPNVKCEVYSGGWPDSDDVLDGADTIIMYCDGGANHPALKHLPALDKQMQRGAGFVCLHYGVEVPRIAVVPSFFNGLVVTSKPTGPSIHTGLPTTNRFQSIRSLVASNHSAPTMNGISICDSNPR